MEKKLVNHKIEWIFFFFFSISLAIVCIFHEPWYDEAQAWQIARCAGLREILFILPHYEGHPALWHLMLLIPARLGLPYELSLGFFSFFAIVLSGWLLLFRSPFPLLLRLLLPFHYFIFYQNGVVSRPYAYMTLSFFLLACFFQKREEHPWKFVLTMTFLCMLSGFGIVLAGGIAIAWLLEIVRFHQWKVWDKSFWRDNRVWALFFLLIVAALLILQILPDKNAYAYSIRSGKQIISNLIYAVFIMIPEGTLLAEASYGGRPVLFIFYILIGLAFWGAMLLYSTRRNRLYFIIPFCCLALFSSIVYFGSHHLSIVVAFVLFWFWIASEDEDRGKTFQKLISNVKIAERDMMILKRTGILLGMLPICIPILWSLVASFHELTQDYFFSRNTAEFIKGHGLDQATFLAEWGEVIEPDWTEEEYFEHVNANGLYVGVDPVAFLPYFDHNFCMNLNGGKDDKAFSIHQVATADESREAFRQLREMGLPEALLGQINLAEIYGDGASNHDYVPVYKIMPRFVTIWKLFLTNTDSFKARYIYVRKDLLEKYGVERIYE